MTEAEVKEVTLGYFKKAWIPGKDLDKFVARDVVRHMHGKVQANGLDELIKLNQGYHEKFSDGELEIPDMLIQGDKVAVRFILELTHVGEFHGFAATNKRITAGGILKGGIAHDNQHLMLLCFRSQNERTCQWTK